MKEIEQNKIAWNLLSEDHYKHYKSYLEKEKSILSDLITKELGNISGKKLIHLQCNTGADTISLARLGAKVTGVDIAPNNIIFARKLAEDFLIDDARFIESDIMRFEEIHSDKYDIVFVSEGAIGWLPDLKKWGRLIKHLLKDDGFFYICDGHPFFLMLDEDKLEQEIISIKYPYFTTEPDVSDTIGGYASDSKIAKNFFWMYKVSDVINALTEAGLHIEFFNEYDTLFYKLGNMTAYEKGQFQYPFFKNKFPAQFSIKATVRK